MPALREAIRALPPSVRPARLGMMGRPDGEGKQEEGEVEEGLVPRGDRLTSQAARLARQHLHAAPHAHHTLGL